MTTRRTLRATAIRVVPLAMGLVLLSNVAARFGVRDILRLLADLRWSLLPVLALYAGHQASRAAALLLCVRTRTAFRFADAWWIRLSGEAVECLTFTGPLLSEPTKAWLLQRAGLQLSDGLAATLTEYLASMVAAAATAVVGVGYVLAQLHPVGPVRAAAIVVLVSMSVFLGILTAAAATRLRIASSLIKALVRRTMPRLEAIEDALIRITRETPRRFASIMLAEFAAQAFLALELWALLLSAHVPCSPMRAALMEGVIKFINAGWFVVPGQLGVAEGSYAVIFSVFGLASVAGVTLSVARRIRTLITALVGLVALIAMRKPLRRNLSIGEGRPRRGRFDDEGGERGADRDGNEQHRDGLMIKPEASGCSQQDQREGAVAHPCPDAGATPFRGELGRIRA
jgi:hypothetical protein